jgi:hypothetical protein
VRCEHVFLNLQRCQRTAYPGSVFAGAHVRPHWTPGVPGDGVAGGRRKKKQGEAWGIPPVRVLKWHRSG